MRHAGPLTKPIRFLHLLTALFALIVMNATAAITFDAASSGTAGSGASVAWSHTVGSGANRMLVVTLTTESTADAPATTVTFGAQSLTRVTNSRAVQGTTNYNATELWYLPAPTQGAGTITVNFSPNVAGATICGAVSLFGVQQAAPEAVATLISPTPAYSLAITTATNGAWLVDVVNNGTANSTFTTTTAGMTARWNLAITAYGAACCTREVLTAGTVTDTWSTPNGVTRSAESIAAFAPAPAGPQPPTVAITSPATLSCGAAPYGHRRCQTLVVPLVSLHIPDTFHGLLFSPGRF